MEYSNIMNKNWPSDGLEYLNSCPVCGSVDYVIMYENLIDNVFFCASGKWTLQSCNNCHSAFLNPRPNMETIHLAYANYYTHTSNKASDTCDEKKLLHIPLKTKIRNGYLNSTYNLNICPSLNIGKYIIKYIIGTGFIRHLPPTRGSIADIGCGNGEYLEFVNNLGWEVWGIDMDPKAVEVCKSKNINVLQGTTKELRNLKDYFDVITLNNVIEHLHDPSSALSDCFQILKPGGFIWICTPNIHAASHNRFKCNWRGLEVPRHLIIFNQKSLKNMLVKCGYHIKYLSGTKNEHNIYTSSIEIKNQTKSINNPFYVLWQIRYANMTSWLNPSRSSEIVIIANKPVKS